MAKVTAQLVALLLGAALAFWLGWVVRPEPEPTFVTAVVPPAQIERSEPDTIIRWRERIVLRTVPAEQRVVAPAAAQPDVDSYCADAVQTALAAATETEPAASLAPQLLLRSGRWNRRLWKRDQLELTGPLSNGDLWQGRYAVRPGAQWRVQGDSVLVQSPRFGLAADALELSPFIAGTVLLCHLFGC